MQAAMIAAISGLLPPYGASGSLVSGSRTSSIALAHDQVTRHDPERAYAVHKALVDAIRSRDRDRIRDAFAKHTLDSAQVLVELMTSSADHR